MVGNVLWLYEGPLVPRASMTRGSKLRIWSRCPQLQPRLVKRRIRDDECVVRGRHTIRGSGTTPWAHYAEPQMKVRSDEVSNPNTAAARGGVRKFWQRTTG